MLKEAVKNSLANTAITALRIFDSIGSTNDEALNWAAHGAPDGALVFADHQSSGRGRLNRNWQTERGSALAFSLITRPVDEEKLVIARFSALGAVALCDCLIQAFTLPAEIKWPNDVLLNRKKTSGILTETTWSGEQIQAVVIGIGINVACSSISSDSNFEFAATSIEDELGRPVDRMEVLKMVVNSFFDWRKSMVKPDFFNFWQEHLAYRGEPVRIIEDGKTIATGKVLGLSQAGELELIAENDAKITVMTGDVHLRPVG
jgi:BirA family transcriptional regulator, biotin operon repressor / biotin---[acetyl-CoA-carboxylase] ligase